MSELLDIVNQNDEIVGQLDKDEVYKQGLAFRVINAFLVNSKKQVWIPRRAAHKKLFPLCLDASVGGHVAAGESYEQAFAREVEEEIGFAPDTYIYSIIGKLNPHDHKVSAFMTVYVIHTDITPSYSPRDFISDTWFDIDTLLLEIDQGAATKGDLPVLIKTLQQHLHGS